MAKEKLIPLSAPGERGDSTSRRQGGKPGLPDLLKRKEDGGGIAAPVRSYYSKPELGTDPDGLHDILKQRSTELGKYGNALWASQRSHESDMWTLNEMMEKYEIIRSGYEANPTEETRAMLCEAMEIVTQQAKKAAGSKAGYGEMYEKYLPVLRAYQTAQENFQSYIQSQQEQLAQWKSTIRDAGSIEADLEEIDRQVLRMAAGPGTEAGQSLYLQGGAPVYGTPYGAKSQAPEKNEERDRLEAQRALLEEELEWSRYFKYNDIRENPDFEEKSGYIPTGGLDERYDYINKNDAVVFRQALEDQRSGAQLTGTDNSHLQLMDEEQVAVYNYLYATEGRDAANEYIRYIEPQLTKMQRAEIEGFVGQASKEHPIIASALSVGMAPLRGLSYLGQAAELLTRGRIDQNAGYNRFSYMPTAVRNRVSELAEEKWGPTGSFAYQTAMSMGDFLLNAGLTGGSGTLSLAVMGSGAAADCTIAAKDRGLDDAQAFTLGTVAGIAEALTEKFSLDKLLDVDLLADGAMKYILANMATEGSEEVASSLINLMADIVVSRDQSEWQASIDAYMEEGLTEGQAFARALGDQALSLALDALGGAISGGVMAGGNAAIQGRRTQRLGSFLEEQKLSQEDIQLFIEEGLESAPDTAAHRIAVEVQRKIESGKALTNEDLSRLWQANVQAVAEEQESQRQGATGLKESGVEKTLEELRRDYREGRISEAEFDAAVEEVMHMEELEEGSSVKNFEAGVEEPRPVSLQTLEDASEGAENDRSKNGGYVNGNTQGRNAGLAVAQSGDRRAAGTDISDGIQIRNAGAGAGEQVGSMGGGPGRQGAQAYSATKAAIERQNTARNLRRRGLIEYSSSKENGLSVGTDAKNILVYPENAWDQELRGIAKRIRGEAGCEVVFTIGGMEFTSAGGEVYNVRGAYTGDKVFIQVDEMRTSANQIASHELFHEKTDRHGVKLLQDLKEKIKTRFSSEEFDAVMDAYIDELWPLYGPSDENAWEEYQGAYNRILEEMLADAYAGINAFGAHADRFTEEVNRHMDQLHLGRQTGQENGTEQPTGPPADRYSYAGERAENADLEALAEAKEMRSAGVADETIRQQTGWFIGMDGKWRWEIDDSGMRYSRRGDLGFRERNQGYDRYRTLTEKAEAYMLGQSDTWLSEEEQRELTYLQRTYSGTFRMDGRITPDALPMTRLSDYLQHDALYEAYPRLRNAYIRFVELQDGTRGSYDPERNLISISENLRGAPENTLIHEIQHAIQNIEGFASGASPEYWEEIQKGEKPVRINDRRIAEAESGIQRILESLPENVAEQFELHRKLEKEDPDAAMELADELSEGPYGDAFSDFFLLTWDLELAEGESNYVRGAGDLYRNTAGEIEARDTAARREMTGQQRRETAPAAGNDLTVFADGAGSFSEVLEELDLDYATPQQAYVDTEFSAEDLRENIRTVAEMEPVVEITGNEFAKGEVDLITQVERFFDGLGNEVRNERLGDVILDRRGVKSDIAHGIGRKKAAAFAAVPDVIRNGLVVDYQENWKDRGYDTAVVAAPVRITGQEHIAGVIVVRSRRSNRFYLHEVMTTENGALPFKTGALKQGDSGGDAPSIFSILDKIRAVKRNPVQDARPSIGDGESLRARMTTKERDILRGVENKLFRNIQGALGANRFSDRSYMKNVIREAADAYLKDGTISEQEMDRLFEMAYEQGIMVDREFYDQYEDVRNHLRTVKVTLSERDRSDIPDFEDFRSRVRYKVKISNDGGLPVDSAYHELNTMAPELFPNSIMHPADQLTRMAEVADSLRINEQNLNDYYGPQAKEFRRDARGEFDRAVWDAVGELQQIRRFRKDKEAAQEKAAQEEKVPTTPEEAMEAWAKLKDARKIYEKVMAKNLLTEEDEMQVGLLLQGKIQPEHLNGEPGAVKSIVAVYEAKREYQRLAKLLAEYRKNTRAELRKDADTYLETANVWKDKKAGILYSRETMQRNVEDIVPDKGIARRVNERFFEPVRDAEAEATRLKTGYRDRVRGMNISQRVDKGNMVSEAHAVQLYGEAMDNIRMLEKSRGRVKQRDGKSLEEWRSAVRTLWEENPGLDKAKIENAISQMRQIYDELFQKMNEVRVRWGYEPVNYRQGYFPHFQPGDGDGIMAQFGRALGIDTQVDALPTTINGLTHTFKPGIRWFGNAQERLGFNTAYDAIEGFDKYIEGVASVICQTENIQRLRALATQMRYRTSDEGIRKQVDAVYANPELTEEQKNSIINDIYANGRYTLSNFVTEVEEYTNLLANKKSRLDRTVEALMGRRFYTAMKWLESRVGANMIAGNITSSLTNFIPLTQASAQLSKREMLQGMWNTLKAYKTDDGITCKSAFLTNRRGSDPLVKTWSDKASEVLSKPMELIDSFTSGSIVRAAYQQNLRRGLSESEAMHQADIFASRVMAERSKGGMPTLFESRNPIFKLATQFQLEVNNQFSEVFKDVPRANRERGLGALAMVLLQYFLGAWMFNELYEKWIGRRPAMDPIDILLSAGQDLFGPDAVGIGEAGVNLANNILEELPFASALTFLGIETDAGRIPVSSAIPDVTALWDAATNKDWAAEKRWKEAQDELNKLAYVIPPFGGNQISKIWKGVKAYIEGGSYSVSSTGEDILQYPVYDDFSSLVQAMILGKSSLREARNWVENGFDSFSAKETAMYQDMVEAGVDQRQAYEFLDLLRGVQATEEETKKSQQMKAILDADVPGDAKAIAYYGLLDKNDKNRGVMDALTDLGADPGEAAEMMIRLREANDLKAAEARALQAEVLRKSSLTESQKKEIVKSWLSKEELTEKGNLSDLGKFNLIMRLGYGVDEYMQYRKNGLVDELIEYAELPESSRSGLSEADWMDMKSRGISADDYLKLVEEGMRSDTALEFLEDMAEAKNAAGDDGLEDIERWKVCVEFSEDTEDQMVALSSVMSQSRMTGVEIADTYGIAPADYVRFCEVQDQYDENGSGTLNQWEVETIINTEFSGLSNEQKAALWQIMCVNTKTAKSNPYSTKIGQKVLDEKRKHKESEEEEEPEGLTLGSW